MTKYLAGVLTVIAAGVLLVAYGLLGPRTSAYAQPGFYQAMPTSYGAEHPFMVNQGYAQPVNGVGSWPAARPVPAVQTAQAVEVAPAPRRVVRTVERAPRRDWKKTAMIIGGSTAAGAGVGAIFGGKKGAAIGAAIAGGATTIYQTTKGRP